VNTRRRRTAARPATPVSPATLIHPASPVNAAPAPGCCGRVEGHAIPGRGATHHVSGRISGYISGHDSGTEEVVVNVEHPVVIAHRAGNALKRLDEARQAGVDLVEADVHLFHGRLEVRHAKTVGPIPLLWDRWELHAPWSERLLLDVMLDAAAGAPPVLLDLKGRHRRLPDMVVASLAQRGLARALGRVSVCARWWPYLDALADIGGIDTIYSAGTVRQVEDLRRHLEGRRVHGVSVHTKALDARRVAALRDVADLVATWPVNDPGTAERMLRLGVNGLITDDLSLARRWIEARRRNDRQEPDDPANGDARP
jgi:glycerophosphoryl diester phosphodiesterase